MILSCTHPIHGYARSRRVFVRSTIGGWYDRGIEDDCFTAGSLAV